MMMLRNFPGRVARRVAASAGFDLVRHDTGILARLHAHGLRPATVIDVGAALGEWSREAVAVFPEARFVLVEPVAEFSPALIATTAMIPRAILVQSAAADEPGVRTFHVHDDLVGSSLLNEREGAEVDGESRAVEVTTVDALVSEHSLEPPFLLKVDVQGAEADVLRGAALTLSQTVAVVCETSFFDFFLGGVSFASLIADMHERGFCVYDVANLARRPLDDALSQADLTFVPAESSLRAEHVYARPEQRAAQTATFSRSIRRRLQRAAGAR
jgi:FkbM family methyltransferase